MTTPTIPLDVLNQALEALKRVINNVEPTHGVPLELRLAAGEAAGRLGYYVEKIAAQPVEIET